MRGTRHAPRVRQVGLAVAIFALTITACTPKLIVQDGEATAWMNVTNTFTLEPGTYYADEGKELWQGILFQIGDEYQSPQGPHSLTMDVVVTDKDGKTKTYNIREFLWVNIVARNPEKSKPPMKPEHLSRLWPDPDNPSAKCGAVDACAGQDCLCKVPPCDDSAALEVIPATCLRQRSLHAYLNPYAVITYWTGPRGWDLALRMHGREPYQIFKLRDKVDVDVTLRDGTVDTYLDADRVTIKEQADTDHHRMMDPPGDG